MLMAVLARQGFPDHVWKFFTSYLVRRGTRYLWNSFSSDRRSADVGMGQGSALSPVLSALYLAPVIKLFESQVAHLNCNVLSYVDDGTLIVQAKDWGSNLNCLREVYRIVFNLFEHFGLVLEHDKSKLFHFTRKCGNTNPPLALGWGPFTEETPLKPKEHWCYLGFFFDWHLLFHEHVRFYATKAISTVRAIGMLGNLFRGLSLRQKHILYRSCVVPIVTYGFKLWYYSGASHKGQVAKLTKMQHRTALWITGAFCTSPVGRVGALAGLIPINLHLQKLAAQSSYRIVTLSPTHPLPALRQRAGSKKVPQHRHSLSKLDYNTCLWVHSSFAKAVYVCCPLNEPFDADADEARPGHRLMDLFSWRIHFEESESKEDVDQAEFLEWQFDLSDAIPSCILVATDASVPTEGKWQAASVAWLRHGGKFLQRTRCAAGRVTAPDAELYAIWIGLGLAMVVPGAKSIKLFTDHFTAVRKVVDPSIHAGQGHSLEVCCMLANWLGTDPEHSVTFVKVLSHLEWGFHKDVHDYITDLGSQVSMGGRPYTSINYARKHATDACQDKWVRLFNSCPLYCSRGFLHLNDSQGQKLQPSYVNGGTWCKHFDTLAEFARFVHGMLNHAPIGSYQDQFRLDGTRYCACSAYKTCHHIFASCAWYKCSHTGYPSGFEECLLFLQTNPLAFLFGNPPRG
jgi:hypothetical protein